ncbi:MAG: iron uptake transporter deferrochelatase/peroxidase subunit [Helicobacter sp.]|nr:iron uptake transporter deferrochelatase/peroxidase subunit [Helicobacter sp.]
MIPFFGVHQAGITTPQQKAVYFISLDLDTDDINEVKQIFKTWTKYGLNLTQGKFVAPYGSNPHVPARDTGEAQDLDASDLTLTFGVSKSFFKKLKIEKLIPDDFTDLPHFPGDQLKPDWTGGDICIQACANDLQVAFHAVRNLVRAVRPYINMRWSQSGFNTHSGNTPRNLFGFRDGTANREEKNVKEVIWQDSNNWLKDGTYLVVRRIQMFLETWDRTSLGEQENTFGRHKSSGAPFGKKKEFDKLNPDAMPEDSHVFLAHSAGVEMLRRSFSYASGIDHKTGYFDTGLLFISFQKDPVQFIAVQESLGSIDKMNEYIKHVGSGLFACFGGIKNSKDYIGSALFRQI